jgi:uncharacterized protein
MHGQFVWYELTTPDASASQRFYPRFTNWGTQSFDKDYTMWTTGGVPFAGIFTLTPEMRAQGIPPNWMPYVETDDVDGAASRVTSLGGTVMHGPADIPGTGRFAVIQDPQGATLGIYKGQNQSRAWDGTPVVGRFSWHELMTTDYAKAFDFYQKVFGWEKMGEMDMGGGNNYVLFGKGKMFGGMFNRFGDMTSIPPFWLVYIHVPDVRKAVEIAKKNGAVVQREPMDIPGGMIAIMGDPQGAAFAVHHAAPAPAAAAPTARASAPAKSSKASKAARPKAVRKATKAKSAKKAKTAKRSSARPKAKAKAKRPTARARGKARKPAAKTSRRAAGRTRPHR